MTASTLEREEEHAKLVREIVTPEGVPIRFTLAPAGDRAAAFILDTAIQIGIVVVVSLGLQYATGGKPSWLTALLTVLSFVLVNFYFALFELRWQGSTPGKRKIGIRVIDARGGQLDSSAILARNLVRELEVWMPIRLLLASELVWPDAPGWALVLAGLWGLVFLLMPMFNKDKLRVGDLIGGTRVVLQPKTVLLPDLAGQKPAVTSGATHTFTEAQLAIYGIYELQILENLLRQKEKPLAHDEAVRAVSAQIRNKLGYAGKVDDDAAFLREFYVALRAHLEQKMLFGQRRENKHARR